MYCGGRSPGDRISDFGFYFLILTGIVTGLICFYTIKLCMEDAATWGKTEEERKAAQQQKIERIYVG